MRIAISAVQGAFIEHQQMLSSLGVECFELRQRADLRRSFDGLILPGGESTVQGKLLRELGMFDELQQLLRQGLPVLGTCAGLILLAQHISNDEQRYFATMPLTVRRNAYGRQLGSFSVTARCGSLEAVPMRFIRAPYIESAEAGVEILAEVGEKIVAARYHNQLGLAFHPELTGDSRLHQLFLSLVRGDSRPKKAVLA